MSSNYSVSNILDNVKKITFKLPTRYNYTEDIKTVVTSDYICGTPIYNYGSCQTDNFLGKKIQLGTIQNYQNYINISAGYESVACNVPNYIYRVCGAFRLKNRGAYLCPNSQFINSGVQLVFKTPDDIDYFKLDNVGKDNTRFIIENKDSKYYLQHFNSGLYVNVDTNGRAILSTTPIAVLAYDDSVPNVENTNTLGYDFKVKLRLQTPDNLYFNIISPTLPSGVLNIFTQNNSTFARSNTLGNFYFEQESEYDKMQYYANIYPSNSITSSSPVYYSIDCTPDGLTVVAVVYFLNTTTNKNVAQILLNKKKIGWNKSYETEWNPGVTISSIATSFDGTYISAIINEQIVISQDGGSSWFVPLGAAMSINSEKKAWKKIKMSRDGRTQIAILDKTIYTSLDFGSNWYNLYTTTFTSNLISISVSSDALFQLVVTSNSIFFSTDGGYNYSQLSLSFTDTFNNCKLSSNGSFLVVSGVTKVYMHKNYAKSITPWESLSYNNVVDMSISSTGMIINLVQNNGLIWSSFDYGSTFSQLYTGLINTTTIKNNVNRNWRGVCTNLSGTQLYFCDYGNTANIYSCVLINSNNDSSLLNIVYNSPVTSSYFYNSAISTFTSTQSSLTDWIQISASENIGQGVSALVAISKSGRVAFNNSSNEWRDKPILVNGVEVVNKNWSSVSVSKLNGNSIVITEKNGIIYQSINNGVSWDVIFDKTEDWKFSNDIYWTSISQSYDASIITAVAYGDGLYIYKINPVTGKLEWNRMKDNTNSLDENRLWVCNAMSNNGQNQTALVYNGPIYVTSTGSDQNPIWFGINLIKNWCCVSMSSDGKNQIAATRDEYIYISKDYGYTWLPVLDKILTDVTLGTIARSPDTYFTSCSISSSGDIMSVTTNNNNIYISNNGGTVWNRYGYLDKPTIEPPFMTSNTLNITSFLSYISTDSGNSQDSYKVFDGYSTTSWSSPSNYVNGIYNGLNTTNNYKGEYIQIKLAYPTRTTNMVITPNSETYIRESPFKFKLFGSVNGNLWVELIEESRIYQSEAPILIPVNSNNFYQYYRLVCNRVNGGSKFSLAGLLFYGTASIKLNQTDYFDSPNMWRNICLYKDGVQHAIASNTTIYQTSVYSSIGRYIYIQSTTNSIGINEIEVYDKNYSKLVISNILSDREVLTSNINDTTIAQYLPLYDSNYLTTYTVDGDTTFNWLRIDLGNEYDIGKIDIYSQFDSIDDCIVYISNNEDTLIKYQSQVIDKTKYIPTETTSLKLYSFIPPISEQIMTKLPINLIYTPSNSLNPGLLAPTNPYQPTIRFRLGYAEDGRDFFLCANYNNLAYRTEKNSNVESYIAEGSYLGLIDSWTLEDNPMYSNYANFQITEDGYIYNLGTKMYLDYNTNDLGVLKLTKIREDNKFTINNLGQITGVNNNKKIYVPNILSSVEAPIFDYVPPAGIINDIILNEYSYTSFDILPQACDFTNVKIQLKDDTNLLYKINNPDKTDDNKWSKINYTFNGVKYFDFIVNKTSGKSIKEIYTNNSIIIGKGDNEFDGIPVQRPPLWYSTNVISWYRARMLSTRIKSVSMTFSDNTKFNSVTYDYTKLSNFPFFSTAVFFKGLWLGFSMGGYYDEMLPTYMLIYVSEDGKKWSIEKVRVTSSMSSASSPIIYKTNDYLVVYYTVGSMLIYTSNGTDYNYVNSYFDAPLNVKDTMVPPNLIKRYVMGQEFEYKNPDNKCFDAIGNSYFLLPNYSNYCNNSTDIIKNDSCVACETDTIPNVTKSECISTIIRPPQPLPPRSRPILPLRAQLVLKDDVGLNYFINSCYNYTGTPPEGKNELDVFLKTHTLDIATSKIFYDALYTNSATTIVKASKFGSLVSYDINRVIQNIWNNPLFPTYDISTFSGSNLLTLEPISDNNKSQYWLSPEKQYIIYYDATKIQFYLYYNPIYRTTFKNFFESNRRDYAIPFFQYYCYFVSSDSSCSTDLSVLFPRSDCYKELQSVQPLVPGIKPLLPMRSDLNFTTDASLLYFINSCYNYQRDFEGKNEFDMFFKTNKLTEGESNSFYNNLYSDSSITVMRMNNSCSFIWKIGFNITGRWTNPLVANSYIDNFDDNELVTLEPIQDSTRSTYWMTPNKTWILYYDSTATNNRKFYIYNNPIYGYGFTDFFYLNGRTKTLPFFQYYCSILKEQQNCLSSHDLFNNNIALPNFSSLKLTTDIGVNTFIRRCYLYQNGVPSDKSNFDRFVRTYKFKDDENEKLTNGLSSSNSIVKMNNYGNIVIRTTINGVTNDWKWISPLFGGSSINFSDTTYITILEGITIGQLRFWLSQNKRWILVYFNSKFTLHYNPIHTPAYNNFKTQNGELKTAPFFKIYCNLIKEQDTSCICDFVQPVLSPFVAQPNLDKIVVENTLVTGDTNTLYIFPINYNIVQSSDGTVNLLFKPTVTSTLYLMYVWYDVTNSSSPVGLAMSNDYNFIDTTPNLTSTKIRKLRFTVMVNFFTVISADINIVINRYVFNNVSLLNKIDNSLITVTNFPFEYKVRQRKDDSKIDLQLTPSINSTFNLTYNWLDMSDTNNPVSLGTTSSLNFINVTPNLTTTLTKRIRLVISVGETDLTSIDTNIICYGVNFVSDNFIFDNITVANILDTSQQSQFTTFPATFNVLQNSNNMVKLNLTPNITTTSNLSLNYSWFNLANPSVVLATTNTYIFEDNTFITSTRTVNLRLIISSPLFPAIYYDINIVIDKFVFNNITVANMIDTSQLSQFTTFPATFNVIQNSNNTIDLKLTPSITSTVSYTYNWFDIDNISTPLSSTNMIYNLVDTRIINSIVTRKLRFTVYSDSFPTVSYDVNIVINKVVINNLTIRDNLSTTNNTVTYNDFSSPIVYSIKRSNSNFVSLKFGADVSTYSGTFSYTWTDLRTNTNLSVVQNTTNKTSTVNFNNQDTTALNFQVRLTITNPNFIDLISTITFTVNIILPDYIYNSLAYYLEQQSTQPIKINVIYESPTNPGIFFIGGRFASIRGSSRTYIAIYNVNSSIDSYYSLSSIQFDLGEIFSLYQVGNYLYVGGSFTQIYYNVTPTSGGIRLRNTSTNLALSPYITRIPITINTTTNTYTAGTPEGISATIFNGPVFTITGYSVYIYIGGNFTSPAKNICRIIHSNSINNPTSLPSVTSIGSGCNGSVNSLLYNSSLNSIYVGGYFTSANGLSNTNRIARINSNNSWLSISSLSPNSGVESLISTSTDLYIGGSFTQIGMNITCNRIARYNYNTSSWSTVGTGFSNGIVKSLAFYNNNLYAGGTFTNTIDINSSGTNKMYRLAMITNPSTTNVSYFSINNGVDNDVLNIIIGNNGSLYAVGSFTGVINNNNMVTNDNSVTIQYATRIYRTASTSTPKTMFATIPLTKHYIKPSPKTMFAAIPQTKQSINIQYKNNYKFYLIIIFVLIVGLLMFRYYKKL